MEGVTLTRSWRVVVNRESIARMIRRRVRPMVHAAAVCAHALGTGMAACAPGTQATADTTPARTPAPPEQAVVLGESQPLAATALDALAPRPEARIEDAYKFLFQATRGGEHAAPDEASARAYLAREWASLSPDPASDEPAIEWLRHDGALVRLHLRPAKARGVSEEAILVAFLASAREVRTDASGFTYAWQALGARLGERPRGHLTRAAWERLDAVMRPANYPAVHHSEPYSAAYAPAYRVMRRGDAEALFTDRR